MQKQQLNMDGKNKKLQKKLEEILPESIKDEGNKSCRVTTLIETEEMCHQIIDDEKLVIIFFT